MEQHDAVGKHHRTGGPRDDEFLVDQLAHAEQAHSIEQHDDVAACDQQAIVGVQDAANLAGVAGDRRRRRSIESLLELAVNAFGTRQVMPVEGPKLGDRVALLGRDHVRIALGLEHLPRRGRELPEAQPVQALLLLEPVLPRPVGRLEVRGDFEQALGACIEFEVRQRQPDHRPDVVNVVLGFLPGGRDDRERAGFDARAGNGLSQVERRPLRAEQ